MMDQQKKMTLDLISVIKKQQKKYFKNEELRDKVGQIETHFLEKSVHYERDPPKILADKDSKSMANMLSPVVKKAFQTPIDSQ